MNLSVSVQYQSALAMLSQLDDQAYQLRRQADSIANQMAMAAQNLLYTMETLDCQMESLKNGIATLDRNLAVMKVQRSRGMIGQLQLDTVENQRVQLVNSQQTLANMREQIGLSLSQLCGLDADTLVEPSTLIMPYEGELDRINAKTGLENAKKNSFDIWSRRVSLRAAQNVYDKNISGTARGREGGGGPACGDAGVSRNGLRHGHSEHEGQPRVAHGGAERADAGEGRSPSGFRQV